MLTALLVAGCVADTRPDDAACRADRIELAVTLTADALAGDTLGVCRGQEVALTVTPEVTGVLHLHGYDEELPAAPVSAGAPVTLSFVAERSGQFTFEFHPEDDPRGIGVGILTVHEP
jgi:hypothetical protein